ncbi:hypothetical protein SAMN04488029_2797 [Reichenbachiella faecimaris]|uniref:Dolichyl-phosphate-mannose-protein mannosyltransferase n=1 Tax=Reichenbachiella faecimaris TaxID=692418 RepID=A0A1W2GJ04_REIFA|nr:hypothetical protein [Reichenbachiella faecimaris]SMD36256.1 hypothetical protein SAMN04488029_2797 [Reichenbachiella faecimaris]
MLTFFKTNDPYRLIGVFLLLLVIRVPIFISGVSMILPELKWLLIGERLGSADYIMYQDVWDYTAPLSVFVYKWLFVFFGKTRVPYFILSIILVVVQAGIFNNVMLRNKAYNSSTYVPALIYMIFMNAFFDFLTLSPVLMSMTFVLLAMNNLFKRMDNQTKDELFIFTGVYLGVATLFYLPSIWFFVVTILSLILYTGSIIRRMMLLIYGFALVLAFAGLYFFWFDDFLIFQHHVFKSLWVIDTIKYLNWTELTLATAVPLLIFITSIYKVRKLGKYINFQEKIQQVMLMFFLSGFLALMMAREVSTYQLIFFVPTVAFFVVHYLLLIKHWLIAELSVGIIVILILFNHLLISKKWFHVDQFVSYEPVMIEKSVYGKLVNGKKVLVLGDELHHYKNASLATPYLNWRLSQIQLKHLNYYDNSAEVFVNFSEDLPEVIIDQEESMPELLGTMPTIASQYIHHEGYPEIYLLKE